MGTTWTISFANPDGRIDTQALDIALQLALQPITEQMSTWETDSVISRINAAEQGWYQLPDGFFHVLSTALDVAAQTKGAYDPTLGRLVELWGFGPGGTITTTPDDKDIRAALNLAGWHRTAINTEHRGIWQPGGLRFDLSSIAKGYGVDQMAAVLDQHAIEHYLVELGGELKARGQNPQGTRWALAIETPETGPDSALQQDTKGISGESGQVSSSSLPISLSDCAIATSGDYRRYFQADGRRYAHTLDSRTGRPLDHNLASVSVLHSECMLADALATALLCLGPEHGPAYARAHRIPAIFMHRHPNDLSVEWTDEFSALTLG